MKPHRSADRPVVWLMAVLTVAAGGAVFVVACASETGPDAPKRTNGCIDLGCAATSGGTSATTPGPDGGSGSRDPLEGTTRSATLVKGGFRFTEGPVWSAGRLLFTDTSANQIRELLPDGGTTQFRGTSNGANGLAVDKDGNLIVCESATKRVTRSAATRGATPNPIATENNGQPFNEPNDVIARADGNIYFTDPNYSGETGTQDDESLYRIAPGGNVSRVGHDFQKPNGVALSPDGNTIYVVDNGAGTLLAAPLDAAGAAGAFSMLASVPGGDGMAVDDAGNLYVADNAGVDVFGRTGNKIGTVTVPVKASNCTFGGADRRTLYITANAAEFDARTGLYAIKLNIAGLP